jgi:tetratricopeptide (TPR) repeat protein
MQSSPMPEGVCTTGVTASQDNAFDREPLLHDFDAAWQSGVAPSLAAMLHRVSDKDGVRHLLEELVKIDLEYRWKGSLTAATDELPAQPLLEDYVRRYPLLGPLEALPLALIGEEYRVRRQWGDRPDLEAYRGRFPQRAEALAALFADIDAELSDGDGEATVRTVGGSGWSPGFVPAGYEIVGELGRGGMGVVYQARQLRLNRLVAIKTIGSGQRASTEDLARFRAEAESAARIQHANIVQVHEVGEQDGQPFCILEYVNGGSLSRKLAGAPLEPHVAARLLETLARAVQAVHEEGILHRDLKPANVLLHLAHRHDADKPLADLLRSPDCVPKISDFGLARRIESSGLTRTGEILGTPSYMAPEQAEARSDRIGPTADVYGLGALLYELLTGRPPFRGVNVLDTLAQVCNREPIAPRQLQPAVPRDVETICLKCLQKDLDKRYASAGALADDLERFRLNRPIQARAASRWERGWKWARRRPALATLGLALFLGLVVALAGGITYTMHLRVARAETENERRQARRSYRKALEAVDQMLVRMGAERIEAIPGMEQAQVDALKDAIRLYQELLDEQARPDPDLYSRLGFALTYLSNRQMTLGRTDEAESNCRRGMELLDNLLAELRTPAVRQQAAFARYNLGNIVSAKNRQAEAERLYREACDILTPRSDDPDALHLLSACYTGLGTLDGDRVRSEENYRRAATLREDLYKSHPNNLSYRTFLAEGLYNLAHGHLYAGRLTEAESLFQRSVALMDPLAASEGNDRLSNRLMAQGTLLHCYAGLGMVYSNRGDVAKSESFYKKAIAISEMLLQFYPQHPRRQELAQCYLNLGALYQCSNQREKAVQVYRKGIALLEVLVRELPELSLYRLNLAQTCANMALIVDNSHADDPLVLLQKGRDALEPLMREQGDEPRFANDYGNLCNNQALVLLYRNEGRKALPWHDRAVAVLKAAHRGHPNDVECTNRYALVLAARGDTLALLKDCQKALPDFDRAIELTVSPEIPRMRFRRAEVLIHLGENRRAVEDIEHLLKRPNLSGDERYNYACLWCRLLASVTKDVSLAATQRKEAEDRYAARALEVLSQLKRDGYFRDPAQWLHLAKDEDLASLRDRDDFKRWKEKP